MNEKFPKANTSLNDTQVTKMTSKAELPNRIKQGGSPRPVTQV